MGKLSKIRRGQIKSAAGVEVPARKKGLDETIERCGGKYHSSDTLFTDTVFESLTRWHVMDHPRLFDGSKAYAKARGLGDYFFRRSPNSDSDAEFFAYHATGVSKRQYNIMTLFERAYLWLVSKDYRSVSYLHRKNPSLTRSAMLDEVRNMRVF